MNEPSAIVTGAPGIVLELGIFALEGRDAAWPGLGRETGSWDRGE